MDFRRPRCYYPKVHVHRSPLLRELEPTIGFGYDDRAREKEEKTLSSTARDVVSRLIARESATTSDPNAAAIAASVLRRITAHLSRFIGTDGCRALLMRALSHAQAAHPVLKDLSIIAQPDLSLHGVPESTLAHGAAETAAGLESTIVVLIELLGRLIGDELAMKLVQNPLDDGLPGKAEAAQ